MGDYVEREAAAKFLREAFCTGCNSYHHVQCRVCNIDDVICALEDAVPSSNVNIVPAGYCRDCQKWHRDEGWCDVHSHFIGRNGEACHPWESSDWNMFDENYFCADFAPKEDNGGN